jgi:translation elongation factor EF-1alpha
MKFDGKDYEEKGPNVASGSMSSGKRVNAHTLEVTDKVKGQVMDHTKFEVSPDGKTLTLTIHEPGQPKPLMIVYDKI